MGNRRLRLVRLALDYTSGGPVELEAVTTERGSCPLGADNRRLETQTSLFTLGLNSPQTFAVQ